MGMDPEGLLFWGFSLGTREEMEDGLPWEPDDETEVEVEDLIAQAAGLTEVTAGDADWSAWYSVPANKRAIHAYWEGFVMVENGPATWDSAKKRIVSTGPATGEISTAKK